jgi:uncharacterized protein YukE
MKQQLFGLRKAHVNKLLKKMKIDFSSKNNQLESELERIISENKQLEREIEDRTNEIPAQIGDLEVWKLGKERIDHVIHYLDEKKTIEMDEIRKIYSEKSHRISQQIEELENEIQLVEKLFSNMLNQFTHLLENPDTYFSSEMKDFTNNEPQMDRDLVIISSNNEVAASTDLIEHGETAQASHFEEEL